MIAAEQQRRIASQQAWKVSKAIIKPSHDGQHDAS
tara:strand:+ start:713 stop:817 length:105 start_codon:yes stop_codon:yes gene_type:complete